MAAAGAAICGRVFLVAVVAATAAQRAASLRAPPQTMPPWQHLMSNALEIPWHSRSRSELLQHVPVWKGAARWLRMSSGEAARRGFRLLGEGAWGKVYSDSGDKAVKLMHHKWILTRRPSEHKTAIDFFDKEAIVLANVQHRSIIRMLGYTKVPTSNERRLRPAILMERAQCSMKEFMRTEPELAVVLDFVRQAMDGVAALAARQLVHGDLCLENLLVFGEAPGQWVKLGDLGFVCSVAENATAFLHCPRFVYRPEFRPPEVWRAMRLNATDEAVRFLRIGSTQAEALEAALALPRGGERPEDPKTDVWAMGVVLYSALFRRSPLEPPQADAKAGFTALCIDKYCPPYMPKGVNHTCEEVCTSWPRTRIQHLLDDFYWGERLERFRPDDVLAYTGPTAEQAARLGGDAWIYPTLRSLLLCMLRDEPAQRCSAHQAAVLLGHVAEDLAAHRGRHSKRQRQRSLSVA